MSTYFYEKKFAQYTKRITFATQLSNSFYAYFNLTLIKHICQHEQVPILSVSLVS